jgi:tetratricopeptide (TPR) repeat protein
MLNVKNKIKTSNQDKPNILETLKLEQALRLAKKKTEEGASKDAKQIYLDILSRFPKNRKAQHCLASFNKLKQESVNQLINLYNQGLFLETVKKANLILENYPEAFMVWNVLGAANKELNRIGESAISFKKVTELNPTYANGFNNLGIVLQELGKVEDAIKAYDKAITMRPNFAEAYYNMGNALKDKDKLEEAIIAYNKAVTIRPDFAEAYYNMGNALKDKDKLEEAIKVYKKTLSLRPKNADAFYNMGTAFQEQGKLELAINAYNSALLIRPNYVNAYYNLGNALKDRGKLEEAINAYNKALSLKPDFANAYNNMGIALQNQGKLEKSLEAYNKALLLQPDSAKTYINKGSILREQGKPKEAIEAYKKALTIKPNSAEAYSNLGIALTDHGKMKEGVEAFNKALSIDPDNAKDYWNLYGTAQNFVEAKKWIKKCLRADPNHLEAKLTLSALQYYEGNMSNFNTYMKSKLKENAHMRSFNWVFNLPKLPPLYFHRWSLFDQMIVMSKKDRPFYEFGVWRGEAFKYLIKTFKKGYGFDTFEGLPEDWHNEKAGTYSSEGNIPKVAGGEFIVGKFEDSLPEFFAKKRPMASIINFDADLYSSTICALNFSKPVIDRHTILIFDEFLINENWEQDEYKALEEFCNKNHFTYEVLAISFFSKQVAVRLLGF